MIRLRKTMLEELQRRNYSDSTVRVYLATIRDFSRHFGQAPDRLGAEHIRRFQVYLLKEKRLAVASVKQRTSALRFFFVKTLRRPYMLEQMPYPKVPRRLSLPKHHSAARNKFSSIWPATRIGLRSRTDGCCPCKMAA